MYLTKSQQKKQINNLSASPCLQQQDAHVVASTESDSLETPYSCPTSPTPPERPPRIHRLSAHSSLSPPTLISACAIYFQVDSSLVTEQATSFSLYCVPPSTSNSIKKCGLVRYPPLEHAFPPSLEEWKKILLEDSVIYC